VPNVGPPRLLDLRGAAAYLSVSTWTIRDLINSGALRRVRVPLGDQGELRKLLLDREDLDQAVARWKEPQV
jgi:excisionase family DNA binding protein